MRKRLLVLFLSFGTIIAFGYALGGLGSYMFGEGRPLIIAAGLAGGAVSAFIALKVWRSYLDDIEKEDREAELKDPKDAAGDLSQYHEEK